MLYQHPVGQRKERLFDLPDAILTSAGPATLARRSLAPSCRRRWSSVADALTNGRVDGSLLRHLLVAALPADPAVARPVWAIDGATWPRPAATTSRERTDAHRIAVGTPQSGSVAGWE